MKSSQYINPYIGYYSKYSEMNIGVLFLSDPVLIRQFIGTGTIQPTWFIRIGNKQKFHFTFQYLSNVPIFSGGGMFSSGFCFANPEDRTSTWVGLSTGPFQNFGLGVKQNIQLTDGMDLLLRGRAGFVESEFEGGLSAGISFNF